MIKLANPSIAEEDIDLVCDVLRSGNLVQGEYVSKLEKEIASMIGVNYCVAVSSGTAALHLCVKLLNLQEGDEIIAPGFTFPATVNVIELEKANIKLVDVNLTDFCIDVSKIENSITSKTKAIIVVHEFGVSAEIEIVSDIAKKHGVVLIEDAACAFGASFNEKKVGSFGDLACFSLHPRKSITSGEGGIIVTNSYEHYIRLIRLRNHGIVIKDRKMDFEEPGFNYRITDFQAALAFNQLNRIDKILDRKRVIAKKICIGLSELSPEYIRLPIQFENRNHTWQTFHVIINHGERQHLIDYLKSEGVETNFGAYAIHELSYYKKKYRYSKEDFPNSSIAYSSGLCIPNHHLLSDSDVDFIVSRIIKFFVG